MRMSAEDMGQLGCKGTSQGTCIHQAHKWDVISSQGYRKGKGKGKYIYVRKKGEKSRYDWTIHSSLY